MARSTKPQACLCGCKASTKGGRFLPGHDAKLKSTLYRKLNDKRTAAKAKKDLKAHGWPLPVEQAS